MTDRRPRICFITAALDPGGSERQLVELATRLPRDRFEVDFILLTERGSDAAVAEAGGARVRALGSSYRATTPFPIFATRVLRKVFRLVSWVRAGRYDIVDAWLWHAYAVAAATRPLTRVPIMISGRRSLSDYKEHFGWFERLMDGLATRSSDLFVANSHLVREDVMAREHIAARRIRVIRNGVLIPPPMPEEDRRSIRQQWGWTDEAIGVGCVASVKPGKGFEMLIEVARDLRSARPDLRYVVIGDGVSKPALERQVADLGLADIVRFHGIEPDARRLYGALDIVVQASDSEGLPNAVLEAAAAGRAVVATAAGGTPEIVTDGVTGLSVPVGDADRLAAAFDRLAGDPDLRLRLGTAARAYVEETFRMDRFVAETAALYEELAAARGLVQRTASPPDAAAPVSDAAVPARPATGEGPTGRG
jgi:glycosyltransferase involved in cell wall biosynthesis